MLFSIFTTLFTLTALVSSTPVSIPDDLPATLPFNSSGEAILTEAELHANVLANYPSERIITSDQLEGFLAKNPGEFVGEDKEPIYLSDKQVWVTPATEADLNSGNHTIAARQSCSWTRERGIVYARPYWAPWHAISSCLKAGSNPAGGYLSISFEESFSVSYSGGLTLAGFEGALGASIGFTITYGYAQQQTYACNVAGGDTVQLWVRHAHGWAYMRERLCQSCPSGGGTSCAGWNYGVVNTPAAVSLTQYHTYGCSAKSKSPLKGC